MSASSTTVLTSALRPLTDAPARGGIFLDIDGTLAPIVARADEARVPESTARLISVLSRRYAFVACVSGRGAAEARRLVGVGGIVYAGTHGAELLEPGTAKPTFAPGVAEWADRVRAFAEEREDVTLRRFRVRLEHKGPIVAFHWRGVPDEDTARERVEEIGREAEEHGFAIHFGRKVLEVRPPVPINKGLAVTSLVRRHGARTALFGGDDRTDLDAWDALDALVAEGVLDAGVRVGVESDEGPSAIVERADVVVDGVKGFARVLSVLAEA